MHCWREKNEWWIDFPPPEDFTGVEWGEWGSRDYRRHCTDEELALLEADYRLVQQERLAEARNKRDQWFAELGEDLKADGIVLAKKIEAVLSAEQ